MRVLAKRMNVALLEMVDQFCFRDVNVKGLHKTTRRQAGRSLEVPQVFGDSTGRELWGCRGVGGYVMVLYWWRRDSGLACVTTAFERSVVGPCFATLLFACHCCFFEHRVCMSYSGFRCVTTLVLNTHSHKIRSKMLYNLYAFSAELNRFCCPSWL